MALKPDRRYLDTDIAHFMDVAAERGGIVSVTATEASGAAMDQSEATVAYVAEPSGAYPLGLLLSEVVNLDLTRQHMNWHKEEVQIGGKVTVMTKGTVVTDWIYPDHTPIPGEIAYVCDSGYIGNVDISLDAGQSLDGVGVSSTRKVGRFVTIKNADGFAKVDINLP
jgi:hypothetical protein